MQYDAMSDIMIKDVMIKDNCLVECTARHHAAGLIN